MKQILFVFLCLASTAWGQNTYSIIPQPDTLIARSGTFAISSETRIILQTNDAPTAAVAKLLSSQIATTTGLELSTEVSLPKATKVAPKTKKQIQTTAFTNAIVFVKSTRAMPEDAYELLVEPNFVKITASAAQGYFYALQTLFQLLPAEIYSTSKIAGLQLTIPCVSVVDKPRFQHRGFMLDVGRHFMPISFIKKTIDLLAMHKMNVLHLHLTEDQGWRIEIMKYPRLTQIGSTRSETVEGKMSYNQPLKFDGKEHSGFYTQNELRDLVKYAQDRFITVVPEIEMPGHALAALAAYPELGCSGGPYGVAKIWGVIEDVYCPTEKTFTFLEDVLTEVMDIFPSKYIHIGGDECPKITWQRSAFCQDLMKAQGLKDEHELQSFFIKRIDKFLTSKGRKLMGWDEILEGGLSPNATVMSWRGVQGGIEAAKQKHDVVMTPNSYVYIDYYQSHPITEPLAIGGFLPLEKVYSYEPVPTELTPEEAKHILGAQVNLWTEYVATPEQAEYMTFPRASALAEVAWTPSINKNFADFSRRVEKHFKRLEVMNVNYAKSIFDVKETSTPNKANKTVEVKLEANINDAQVHYSLDFSKPTANSPVFLPQTFNKLTTVRAAVFRNGQQVGKEFVKTYRMPDK
ncbi:Glycoside hydrolase, family 20, catalytic core [Emticicia oligotrophica DSM 17448]|uniref:beta-N-acetylhexosaminidase n=1 Tax=Emticicia oligotrophica (strain DSM 17448 / CIP 109782 / MTCC 6937 / GPTSA100-15) TaxID=929562 RepID=A0ABM5N1I0_EMTOG|nr:family 20 glycosylhydrolase [Emticicia oligotrophica]AFK03288.1 Glycoside hydrolase, family 20, catalytic core [Emticicia oligotrophica DSM 17448]